jgi:hypothetical protein
MSFSIPNRTLAGVLGVMVLGLLPSCSTTPVSSMVRLASTDFSTVDPAALRVAVKAPQNLKPRRGGVKLTLAGTLDGASQKHEFILADLADPAELLSLRTELSPGTAVHAFRLEPADVTRLTVIRDRLLEAKQRGAASSMTIGVGADGCRAGPLPDRPLLSTYLRTEAGGAFFALARDIDLREMLRGESMDAKLPPC